MRVEENLSLPVEGSAVRAAGRLLQLDGGSIVVSWFEGAESARFALLDPRSGTWKRGKGISGRVLDAIARPAIDRAWLLCSYGLFEIELSTAKVLRKLRKGLGTHQHALTQLDGETVGVSARFGRSMSLVSTRSMEIVGRMRLAAPDVTIQFEETQLMMSFEMGTARRVKDLKPVGKAAPITRAASAMAVGSRVAYLPSEESISDRALESALAAPPRDQEFFRNAFSTHESRGTIGWFDPQSMVVVSEGADVGADRLLAHSDDGHLFAASRWSGVHRSGNWEQSLLVLDSEGQEVLDRISFTGGIVDAVSLPGAVLVWQGRPDEPHVTVLTDLP